MTGAKKITFFITSSVDFASYFTFVDYFNRLISLLEVIPMKKVKQVYQRASKTVFYKSCTLSAFIASVPFFQSFALAGLSDPAGDVSTAKVDVTDWPWTRFLNALADQLTGPLPMILGVLGLAVAAIGMFMGNHGAGMQKALVLIFAVSICLFAPSFITYIGQGVGTSGLTIFG